MDTILFIIELIGVFAFGFSGAVVAIDKETDLVGVIFLSNITTFGGGIMRDLIIGRIPAFFNDLWLLVLICTLTSILVFFIARLSKKWYVKNKEFVLQINNYIDAAGLGAFAVASVKITMELCPEEGPFLAIMMGVVTAIGGGMVRDVCLCDVPFVFRKRIYALAAAAGSVLYYCIAAYWIPNETGEIIACIVGLISVFLIRVCATVFHLNMPKAIKFSEQQEIAHEIEEEEAHRKEQETVKTK